MTREVTIPWQILDDLVRAATALLEYYNAPATTGAPATQAEPAHRIDFSTMKVPTTTDQEELAWLELTLADLYPDVTVSISDDRAVEIIKHTGCERDLLHDVITIMQHNTVPVRSPVGLFLSILRSKSTDAIRAEAERLRRRGPSQEVQVQQSLRQAEQRMTDLPDQVTPENEKIAALRAAVSMRRGSSG